MAWRDKARCVGLDPNIFFADDGDVSRAKEVCHGCEVQAECLDYALKNNVDFGVWGGSSGPERRAVRRKNRRESALSEQSAILA